LTTTTTTTLPETPPPSDTMPGRDQPREDEGDDNLNQVPPPNLLEVFWMYLGVMFHPAFK
jgi:hypothetical protein